MAKEQSQIRERQRTNLKEPRRYKVIIYNDDFTTMEFVVMILVQVFHLPLHRHRDVVRLLRRLPFCIRQLSFSANRQRWKECQPCRLQLRLCLHHVQVCSPQVCVVFQCRLYQIP